MEDKISVGRFYPNPVPPAGLNRSAGAQSARPPQGPSFATVLQGNLLQFSHHAEMRLKQRGIEFKPDQLAKIQAAVEKAAAKGAKDSLVLVQDTALIVNIKNRTVVTAMDGSSMKDNVFTQIDSAVVVS